MDTIENHELFLEFVKKEFRDEPDGWYLDEKLSDDERHVFIFGWETASATWESPAEGHDFAFDLRVIETDETGLVTKYEVINLEDLGSN